jgi:hypothetical protein
VNVINPLMTVHRAVRLTAVACGFALPSVGRADADGPDFSLGIGYANVSLLGDDSAVDSENALRLEGVVTISPIPVVPQLRLGGAISSTMVFDNSQFILVSDGGAFFAGKADVPLWLFEPEVRLSWRQYFDDAQSFFIEPGAAFGGVLANLSLDGQDTSTGQSFNEWESTLAARAFLNVGFLVTGGVAGVQASYMRGGEIDFAQNARGDVQEWYVGFFGALRF